MTLVSETPFDRHLAEIFRDAFAGKIEKAKKDVVIADIFAARTKAELLDFFTVTGIIINNPKLALRSIGNHCARGYAAGKETFETINTEMDRLAPQMAQNVALHDLLIGKGDEDQLGELPPERVKIVSTWLTEMGRAYASERIEALYGITVS
jgi:hypothetical protein